MWFARRRRLTRKFFLVAAGVWATLVAAVSFLPLEYKQDLHSRGRFHNWGHVLAFGSLAYVLVRAVRRPWVRLLLCTGSLVFAFAIEYFQHLTDGMALEWTDVLVDIAAVVTGTMLAFLTAGDSFTA